MDKYTIDMESHFEDGWIVEKDGEFEAEFNTQEKALEYIAWKNQLRINKDLKDKLIVMAKHYPFLMNEEWVTDEQIKIREIGLEIISNLPTGEN